MVMDPEPNIYAQGLNFLLWSWGHGLGNKSATLLGKANSIREQQQAPSPTSLNKIGATVDDIRRIAAELPLLASPFQMEDVSRNALVRDRVEMWKQDASDESLKFEITLCRDEPCVGANPIWLRRLRDSFVDNAIAAMEESTIRHMTINTEVRAGKAIVSMHDTETGNTPRPTLSALPPFSPSSGRGRGLYIASLLVSIYGALPASGYR